MLPVPQKSLLSARMATHIKCAVLENPTGTRIAKQARMESARGAETRDSHRKYGPMLTPLTT